MYLPGKSSSVSDEFATRITFDFKGELGDRCSTIFVADFNGIRLRDDITIVSSDTVPGEEGIGGGSIVPNGVLL